ncbi:unnamed protein product [Bemisia tabaci]|uniref:RNA methyltransferase n=1 Tax=Bemisia tabaci TaxID=7038 RepID=A0A9P0EYV5_BEMTA|nr:unnamed protein product [Bemisia tabaci]
MKRPGTTKDVGIRRKEYKERKKKRSEKIVGKILNSMAADESSESQTKSGPTIRSNSCDSQIPRMSRTLSIAVPASILDNAQSAELRTYLGGQIARAACIFKVDEIIVFNDVEDSKGESNYDIQQSCYQLARILQYLECPQYLRKTLFPIHQSLQYAGLLNPLDAPHHLRANDESLFREGIVSKCPPKPNVGSYVSVGLPKDVLVDKILEPSLRVTVRLEPNDRGAKLQGKIVSPTTPKEEAGLYWGYTVRVASCLQEVFSNCPYEGAYDLTIGTSDKGDSLYDLNKEHFHQFSHTLVVFGGLLGLEAALKADHNIPVSNIRQLFDHYLNTCPNQGSRTIRTEEAILITLTALTRYLSV